MKGLPAPAAPALGDALPEKSDLVSIGLFGELQPDLGERWGARVRAFLYAFDLLGLDDWDQEALCGS